MSEAFDTIDPVDPHRDQPGSASQASAQYGTYGTSPSAYPTWSGQGFAPRMQPESGVYPPPPEYYLPRRDVQTFPAFPPPPPEHAAVGTAVGAVVGAQPAKRGGWGNPVLFLVSAAISFVLYAAYGEYAGYNGWEFGLGLILLLFVHEMGHFVVIRAKGLPASLPIFIPFLGAFVAMRRMPKTVRDEAEIALAGPLAGALGGGVCFALYWAFGGPDGQGFLYLAYFSFLINLLNLAPISPLDGGRVAGAISRWFFLLGLVLLGAAFVYNWTQLHSLNLLLLLLGWLWLTQTIARFRMSNRQPYYAIGLASRVYISILYLALIGALALALYVTQTLLSGNLFPLQ